MSKLETTTHVCLIAVAVLCAGLLLERRFAPVKVGQPVTNDQLVGKRLDVRGLDWALARTNAILFISTRCHFCQESMPFYQRLSDTLRNVPGVAISVVSAEPPAQIEEYLVKKHVTIDRAYQVSLPDFVVRGTPTLFIADSSGIVRRAFIGTLSSAQEEEFLALFRGPKVVK